MRAFIKTGVLLCLLLLKHALVSAQSNSDRHMQLYAGIVDYRSFTQNSFEFSYSRHNRSTGHFSRYTSAGAGFSSSKNTLHQSENDRGAFLHLSGGYEFRLFTGTFIIPYVQTGCGLQYFEYFAGEPRNGHPRPGNNRQFDFLISGAAGFYFNLNVFRISITPFSGRSTWNPDRFAAVNVSAGVSF
jgi:hypothetical protein